MHIKTLKIMGHHILFYKRLLVRTSSHGAMLENDVIVSLLKVSN